MTQFRKRRQHIKVSRHRFNHFTFLRQRRIFQEERNSGPSMINRPLFISHTRRKTQLLRTVVRHKYHNGIFLNPQIRDFLKQFANVIVYVADHAIYLSSILFVLLAHLKLHWIFSFKFNGRVCIFVHLIIRIRYLQRRMRRIK